DIKKEHQNFVRMKILGANVVPFRFGAKTLKEALDSAFEAYLSDPVNSIYAIGSVVGPHPFPKMVRDFQAIVGFEAREQFIEMTGELPDIVCACVGGGSNAMGIFSGFIDDAVRLVGIEPLGRGSKLGEHAASLSYGEEGVMHGFNSIMLKDSSGEPAPVYSVASGLDYPSVGPEHAYLHSINRTEVATISDKEAISAFFALSRKEGIIPAIESSHAVAYALKIAKELKGQKILVNLSGRGDKDIDFVVENYGYGE
ncbi:MAG: pyridoxal-phosphate dependent enzyme, partial [Helicobacter sp.]|nr:pyridoxal-phosphate dependent enzyme [Helicobacter sp.]